ncbi:MAG: hypothetical protein ACREH4_16415 [Vitreimonas sp.]
MSNSMRIWLMYFWSALALVSPFWLALTALGIRRIFPSLGEDFVGWIVLPGFVLVVGLTFFLQAAHWKCWRCGAPLSRAPVGGHWPIVWWTKCPQCGVPHSSAAEMSER